MRPGENLNTVAAEQIRSWLRQAPPAAPLPVFTFDAGYDAAHWTWLLILASVPLRLARDQVADVRFPWQPPLPAERRTPARVRRGFSLLLLLGTPANVPKPCGHSPGRPEGNRSPPARRCPAVKLTL